MTKDREQPKDYIEGGANETARQVLAAILVGAIGALGTGLVWSGVNTINLLNTTNFLNSERSKHSAAISDLRGRVRKLENDLIRNEANDRNYHEEMKWRERDQH